MTKGNDGPFVAYYRVSTERQGESGLGLEAQREAVSRFLGSTSLLAEFTEIESGKRPQRPLHLWADGDRRRVRRRRHAPGKPAHHPHPGGLCRA